jgi:hypothetical protein
MTTDPAAPGTPAPTETPPPGAYIPTTEKPDVTPPVPHAFPASSAPLPEGVLKEEIKTSTPSVQ